MSEDRTHLSLGPSPYYFCGANVYYLMTRAADPNTRGDVITVLDDLEAAGVTVVRTWAFNDGPDQWNALQPSPGVFDERVFRALDLVVYEAGRRGLRLLFNLINFWEDYGGMKQYVRWSRAARGLPDSDAEAAQFYEDGWCRAVYGGFIKTLLLRINTITDVVYKDDPTILGWGLANEPQCRLDPGGERGTIAAWAEWAAKLIKRIDTNHLVFMDCEGFLGHSTPEKFHCNPYDCAATGCDFAKDCASTAIDVACCHLYPDLWLPNASSSARLLFSLKWIDAHVNLCRVLGKPLVLSEFGKKLGGRGDREEFYAALLERCVKHMRAGAPMAGTAFWMAAAPSYPDHDGFSVYFSGRRGKFDPAREQTPEAIEGHIAEIQGLNHHEAPNPGEEGIVRKRSSKISGVESVESARAKEMEVGEGCGCCGCRTQ